MNASLLERIETIVEHVACAIFAAAVVFAFYTGLNRAIGQPPMALCVALTAGAVIFVLGIRALISMRIERPHFEIAAFEPAELEMWQQDELVLTDADRLVPSPGHVDQEPLVLDDILAELGPESRVVRLFDRSSMPSPGHLKSKIDDHLRKPDQKSASADASHALSQALAELRRSLR